MVDRRSDDGRVSRRGLLKVGAIASGGALMSSNGLALTPRRGEPALDTSAVPQHSETDGVLTCGDSVSGQLTSEDDGGFLGAGYHADFYQFDGNDSFVTISMRTEWSYEDETEPEPLLYLLDSDGGIVATGTIEYEYIDETEYIYSQISALSHPGTGPYTIVATTYSPDSYLDYQLSVDCLTFAPEATIECGQTVSGALTSDDPTGFSGRNRFYDAYVLPVPEDELIRVKVITPNPDDSGSSDDPSLGDSYLYLLSPTGEIVAENDDWNGLDSALSYHSSQGGEYTVVVSSFGPRDEFEYELAVTCRTPPEPTQVECGQVVTGELTLDDQPSFVDEFSVQDVYRTQGTAGEEVTITVEATEPYGYADPALYLLDPDGSVIAESEYSSTGQDALLAHTLPVTGEYIITVAGYIYEESFPYELTLACDTEPFYCEVRCDESIDYGQTVVDGLTAADDKGFRGPRYLHDAYCFDAQAGDVVTISMATAAFGYEIPYLYLVGPANTILSQDRDGGGYGNAIIQNYEIQESGMYRIVATSATEATLFDYTLALQSTGTEQPGASEEAYYQVDFVAGEPIEDLGEDGLYGEQDRLVRFALGSTDDGITERGRAWATEEIRSCIESAGIIRRDGETAQIDFTLSDSCENVPMSLVSYVMPNADFSFETADQQALFDATTETVGPGEHTLTVTLPTGEGRTD